jgi:tetratricopeptide (TPR) repeat protein
LGTVAQEQGRFEEAIGFCKTALKIFEDAGDFYSAAKEYHLLGMVAQEQRRFDEAIGFYKTALQIKEDKEDFYSAASDYHHLGRVAEEQECFDDAVAYFQKAFEATSAANDWRQASAILTAWGGTLEAQSNWTEAEKIYIRALAIDIEHNSEWVYSDLKNLGRMLKQLGDSQFQVIWREFTGDECPGELFPAIQKASSIDPN